MVISSTYSRNVSKTVRFVNMSRARSSHPRRPYDALLALPPPVDLETKSILKRCVTARGVGGWKTCYQALGLVRRAPVPARRRAVDG